VAAFKGVSAESLKSIRDVAAIYGKLFTDVDAQAKAFVEANRAAKKDAPTGFDPAFVELVQIPAPVHPAYELAADEQRLKEAIQELPQQNGGAYRKFNFTEINE